MSQDCVRVRVELDERSYEIDIAHEFDHKSLGRALEGRRAFWISDTNVARHYPDMLKNHPCYILPAGEASKCLVEMEKVVGVLLESGFDRSSTVVAFGGGVVGDLAGFVAATYMRGVEFIQLPTTLLAMVDSSVGGKVAVNHAAGKNMIGAFYQPRLVSIGTAWLSTLPERERRSGLAEVIKYGIISDATFFGWLETHLEKLLSLDTPALHHAIARSVQIKADTVARDERETGGDRALLNLGHTFAHAEELLCGYGQVLHGEAVAAGMVAACQLGVQLGTMPRADADRVEALIARAGLPVRLQSWKRRDAFWKAMQSDKKSASGSVRFILPGPIGAARRPEKVERSVVEKALEKL